MQKQTPQELANFDFLARSFARMQSLGRPVDIRARYEHYRTQAVRAKEQTLEVC